MNATFTGTSRARLGIAGLLLCASLSAPTVAVAGDERPISGRFTAQGFPAEPRCGDDALTLGFEIRGTAAHLGALSGSGSNCTELSLATEAVEIWDGQATFTAADGSTITTVSDGSQAAPIGGRAEFTTNHTITGGTGRFAGATGEWTVTGAIDFTTGQIAGQVSGWLAY